MALKVKAVERLLKFDKESAGKYRYVLKPEIYSTLSQAKVIKEAAMRSGVSMLLQTSFHHARNGFLCQSQHKGFGLHDYSI